MHKNIDYKDIFDLTKDFVYAYIKLRPLVGTTWGIPDYNGIWGDLTTESFKQELNLLTDYQSILNNFYFDKNSKWEELAYITLKDFVNMKIKSIEIEEYYIDLNSIYSTFQMMIYCFEDMHKETKEDWNNIVSRLLTMDIALKQYISRLKDGIRENKVVAKRQILAVIEQAEDIKKNFGTELKGKNKELNFVNQDELEKLCNKSEIYQDFIDFLKNDYLPVAKDHDYVGKEYYEWTIVNYIGNPIDIMETYNWGFSEINKLLAEIKNLCFKIDPNFKSYLDIIKLASEDQNFIIHDHDEFLKFIKQKELEAINKLEKYFDIPDVLKMVDVKRIPIDTSLAQYVPPSPDFCRNGCISYAFERDKPIPLYDQLSTAYHEGFPGHHLQCGLQVYFKDNLSLLGRLIGYSGHAEGWALYAERFMEEQGLYEHPYYTLGMLICSLFRACRIVIDIGIHLQLQIPNDFVHDSFNHPGEIWSFELAKELFMNVAGLPEKMSVDEINRYCGWPGQAISYKVGERVILELREYYKSVCIKLNIPVDLKYFHNLILQYGSVSLDYLERKVKEEINLLA